MRPSLQLLNGGGIPSGCALCARGLYLGPFGAAADEETGKAMLAVLQEYPDGRIQVCGDHADDLRGLGVKLVAPVAEVKPRRQRRASAAAMRRAHRKAVKGAAEKIVMRQRQVPREGGEGGGIAF